MKAFLWLLSAIGALGAFFPIATWEAHLKAINSNLPLLTATNSEICYNFDLSQSCSADAINTLIGPITLEGWTPTAEQCASLLEKQLAYLEVIA